MPKQNAQSKPPHRPARRKTKPKFDIPEGIGEPAAATWVYREDLTILPDEAPVTPVAAAAEPPTPVPSTPVPPTPAAAIAETIAAPIAVAIEATASIAPEPARLEQANRPRPDAYYQTRETSHDIPQPVSRSMLQAAAMGLIGISFGMIDFVATTTVKLAAIPLGIARRLMPD